MAKKAKNQMSFTKANIRELILKNNGTRKEYKDSKQSHLFVGINKTQATFYVRKRITQGKHPKKFIIGSFDPNNSFTSLSIEQVRKEAAKICGAIALGRDPLDSKKSTPNTITLKELFEKFMKEHAEPSNKEKTNKVYRSMFEKRLKPLHNKRIKDIKREHLAEIHNSIASEGSLYMANRVLKFAKTMFNRAIDWELSEKNPAMRIKPRTETKRQVLVEDSEMPCFLKAVYLELNSDIKDFILLSLFTGARRETTLSMRWEHVDFKRKIWETPTGKNKKPQRMYLCNQAVDILKSRKQNQLALKDNAFVFPSPKSKLKYLRDPKRGWERILASAGITRNIRIHDLRRTFASNLGRILKSDIMVKKL